jgi:hypothetical protein
MDFFVGFFLGVLVSNVINLYAASLQEPDPNINNITADPNLAKKQTSPGTRDSKQK